MVQIRDPATGRMIEVERRPIRRPSPAHLGVDPRDLARAQAQLAEANGVHTFVGLYDGDRRVRARVVAGRFGLTWLLDGDDEARLGKWVTYGPTSRQQKAKGLKERPELDHAEVRADGRHVAFVRTGCKWGQDARLKFTGAKS